MEQPGHLRALPSPHVQNVEEMAAYTKLQQRLTAERRAVAVLQTEALRERTARTSAALDAATLPCPVGAGSVVSAMRRPCCRGRGDSLVQLPCQCDKP